MKKVENYYDQNSQIEWERLDRHQMEFAITKKHLKMSQTEKRHYQSV